MRRLPAAAAAALALWAGAALGEQRNTARVTLASDAAKGVARRCGVCHSPEYALWVTHAHSHFLADPEAEPKRLRAGWTRATPGWKEHVEGKFSRSDVALAYGLLEVQLYFRRAPDGLRLLPAQWNIGARRWEPLAATLARERETTWEVGCAGCHTTGFNVETGTYAERNVGCPACHGDGRRHLESGGREPILRPSKLAAERRSELCGRCHSRGKDRKTGRPYPTAYVPGGVLSESFEVAAPVQGTKTEHFWPDGTERQAFMQYQGFIQSRHYRKGLACTTCHLPHGSDQPENLRHKAAGICENCHIGQADCPECPVHGVHPRKARCVDCHMSEINPRTGGSRAHTHTFRFLEPSRAVGTDMPNSCTVSCHRNRDGAWAEAILVKWRAR
jgi:predicted CXXCH cytochrome family protein